MTLALLARPLNKCGIYTDTHYSQKPKQGEDLKPLDGWQPSSPTFTAKQVSELVQVPLSKVYSIRKTELRPGHHYQETLNTSNSKCLTFTAAGISKIETTCWLSIGRKSGWSEARLKCFEIASLWLAEVTA